MTRQLLDELDVLTRALVAGDEVEGEAILLLMERVRDAAPGSTQDEIAQMKRAVDASEQALRTHYERVGEELKRLQRGRTALQGYNHLRGFDQGQRLFRQA